MIDDIVNNARNRMDETMGSLQRDLDSISTGRANPAALDVVKAEVYGSLMPLNQLASVSTADASTLTVQVWDRSNVKAVEKGIINSNLGFNPMVDGQLLRIAIPKLSQERRVELSKLSKKYGEDKKVALRNVRRDAIDDIKKQEKDLGKDTVHAHSDVIQKITDEFVAKIDEEVSKKEKDLMTV